jgi:hypothetical protein
MAPERRWMELDSWFVLLIELCVELCVELNKEVANEGTGFSKENL